MRSAPRNMVKTALTGAMRSGFWVTNGEGSNLSPSRTDPPPHASEAVASGTTLANIWTDFDLHISTPISVDDVFPRRVGSEMCGFDWIGPIKPQPSK